MKNITDRALDFVNYLESEEGRSDYGTRVIVDKESTWTPYYAIFIATPEYASPRFIQDRLEKDLKDNFPDCEVRFNKVLNEIEIEHSKSAAFFDKHRRILEEIGMEYAGWTAFLTDK